MPPPLALNGGPHPGSSYANHYENLRVNHYEIHPYRLQESPALMVRFESREHPPLIYRLDLMIHYQNAMRLTSHGRHQSVVPRYAPHQSCAPLPQLYRLVSADLDRVPRGDPDPRHAAALRCGS